MVSAQSPLERGDSVLPPESVSLAVAPFLRAVPFFSQLSDVELAELIAHGSLLTVAPGATIFREGDAADRLYVVTAGQVRVFRTDAGGNEVDLATVEAGGFFGELALLD